MENIRNLELVRIHKEIQGIKALLKSSTEQNILDAIERLADLETRLHNLAYGDCQFVHRLPYPVKPSVKRGRLHVFPKVSETGDVA